MRTFYLIFLQATLIRHFYRNAECVTGKTPQRLLAVESVSPVLRILTKQALFTAEVATTMPAFVTRVDASWGRCWLQFRLLAVTVGTLRA
jgi:hypothetical protein